MHTYKPRPTAFQGKVLLAIASAVDATASLLRYDEEYRTQIGTNNPFGDKQLKVLFTIA